MRGTGSKTRLSLVIPVFNEQANIALLAAEIDAARDLGMRFHPTRGSMSLSEKDGGLPPDEDRRDVVTDGEDPAVVLEKHRRLGHCLPGDGAVLRRPEIPPVARQRSRRGQAAGEQARPHLHTEDATNGIVESSL